MSFFLLKLLGIGKWLREAATAAFRWIVASPTHMLIFALCVSLAGNFWQFRGNTKRDHIIAAKDAQIAQIIADAKQAEANAIAAKLAQEAKDEQRRKKADEHLKQDMADDRRLADAYASRMRCQAPRSAPRSADLPSTPEAPQVADGPGDVAELVGITRTDLDLCTINSRRLQNAHDWAVGE